MTKNIIEWGSNTEYTIPMATYLTNAGYYANMQGSIADGSILSLEDNDGVNQRPYLYSSTYLDLDNFSDFIDACKTRAQLGWGRTQKQFLNFGFYGGGFDWFSSQIAPFINNMSVMGQVVKNAGIAGLLFDGEPYGADPWQYSVMPQRSAYTITQYKAQVRAVARQIGLKWRQIDPDFCLMLEKSYPSAYKDIDVVGEATSEYGLYPSWVDGLFDAFGETQTVMVGGLGGVRSRPSKGKIILIDGEQWHTYNVTLRQDAIDDLQGLTEDRFQGESQYFNDVAEFGKLLWIDFPGLDGGPYPLFDNTTPANSFYDQDQFVDYCEFVLGQLDWLVIFNQYYNFWSNTTFGSGVLNSLYIDALRQMRLDMGLK